MEKGSGNGASRAPQIGLALLNSGEGQTSAMSSSSRALPDANEVHSTEGDEAGKLPRPTGPERGDLAAWMSPVVGGEGAGAHAACIARSPRPLISQSSAGPTSARAPGARGGRLGGKLGGESAGCHAAAEKLSEFQRRYRAVGKISRTVLRWDQAHGVGLAAACVPALRRCPADAHLQTDKTGIIVDARGSEGISTLRTTSAPPAYTPRASTRLCT